MRGGTAAEEIAVVCPSRRALARTARDRVRRARRPVRGRGHASGSRRRRSARRSLRCCASPGSAAAGATSTASCARRTPASRAPHVDYLEGRLRGRAVGGRAGRGGDAARCAASRCRRSSGCARRREPLAAVRELAASMLRAALRPRRPARRRGRAPLDLRAHAPCSSSAPSSRGGSGSAASCSREELVAALERAPVRLGGAASPGRVAVLDLLRARTRRFGVVFVLGLEEGSLPRRARRRRRSSTTTAAASSTSAAARACSGRIRSRASATSSTPPARAPRGGSTSSARRRARRGRRASRARSGTRCAALFGPDDVRALDAAAAALGARLAARGARRRSASALRALAALAARDVEGAARRGARERLGAAPRARARRVRAADAAATSGGARASCARARPSA